MNSVFLHPEATPFDIAAPKNRPSLWKIQGESATSYTLRRLNLAGPLGSFFEIVIPRTSPAILGLA